MTKPVNFALIKIIIIETRDHAIEKLSECWKLQANLRLTYIKGISGQIFRIGLGFQGKVSFLPVMLFAVCFI
ncbi:hypothetical protein HMPREF3001_03925 [Enterococcus sp. HMSC066C04]|nr:hypothetical protein HMPREF3001_03925 [Enterococcus sp. HMSC066C04]